jgi:Hg(II)-responsive transcriptional regulator
MAMTSKPLTIGHLAGHAGVGVETIRYYQRRGLLPLPDRQNGAYRSYSEEQVDRIRFIKRAQELGFSLDEVAELLRLHDGTDRDSIRRIAAERLAEIRGRIADLEKMRTMLEGLIDSCEHTDTEHACPIIGALSGEKCC